MPQPVQPAFDPVAWTLGGLRGSVVGPASDEYPCQSEGTTIKLRDGSLIHAFNQRSRIPDMTRWHAHSAPTVIAKVVSRDGGRSWAAPQVMFESNTGQNASHPALVCLPNGEIGATYQRIDTVTVDRMERDREHWLRSVKTADKVFRYSSDEGETWSDEILISPTGGYWTSAHDRLLALSTGRIVQPLHTIPGERPGVIMTKTAWSDDNGRTWKLSDQFLEVTDLRSGYQGSLTSNFQEAAIAERADGSLFLIGRTSAGRLYSCISEDGAESWTRPQPTHLRSPQAPANVARVPDSDDLLLIWNDRCVSSEHVHGGHRLTLSSVISTDGGRTWKWRRELVSIAPPDPPAKSCLQFRVCYPSIYIDERTVYVGYWAGARVGDRPRDQEYMAVLPLSWFYALRDYHVPQTAGDTGAA